MIEILDLYYTNSIGYIPTLLNNRIYFKIKILKQSNKDLR